MIQLTEKIICQRVNNFLFEKFGNDTNFDLFLFQQDGAPSHFSIDVRHYLDNRFLNRWIGRGGATQ